MGDNKELWNNVAKIWQDIAEMKQPPTGAVGDELRVWARDCSPLDIWRVMRALHLKASGALDEVSNPCVCCGKELGKVYFADVPGVGDVCCECHSAFDSRKGGK